MKGCSSDQADVCAGWKESQTVFTDALATLITAESTAYAQDSSAPHLEQAASTRRLLAKPQHANMDHTLEQPAAVTGQPELNSASRPGIAGTARSTNFKNSSSGDSGPNRLAQDAHDLPADQMSIIDAVPLDQSGQHAQHLGVCQADAPSTVCADKDQPVLAAQPWEQEDRSPNHGLQLQQCQLLNVSVCEPSVQLSKKGKGFIVAVYNALAWERPTEPIRVPLSVAAGRAARWTVTGM